MIVWHIWYACLSWLTCICYLSVTNYCDGASCGNAICVNMPQSRNYSCVCDDEAKFNATTKKCEFLKNCTCKNNGTCSKIDGQPKCR